MSFEISTDWTPEQVDAVLTSMQSEGQLAYVLPSDPIGEVWVLGIPDGGLLKLDHPGVIAFIIGNQLALQFAMKIIHSGRLPR